MTNGGLFLHGVGFFVMRRFEEKQSKKMRFSLDWNDDEEMHGEDFFCCSQMMGMREIKNGMDEWRVEGMD